MNILAGCRGILAAFFMIIPASVLGQDVVLSAKTGDLKVEGKLLDFDGEFFQVETKFGPMTVDARTVTCGGEGCPTAKDTVVHLEFYGDGPLVPALVEAFALYQGAEVEIATSGDGAQVFTIQSDAAGTLAKIDFAAPDPENPFAILGTDRDILVFSSAKVTDPSRARVVALDGVVIAGSDVNPVDAISVAQMRDVAAE